MSFLGSIGGFFSGLFGAQDIPQTKITAAETKTAVFDPRHPRQLMLGRSGWQGSVAWAREHDFTGGGSSPKECTTQILVVADHPMGAVEEILIGERIYTVGTNATANGDDFVPKTDDEANPDTQFDWNTELPGDWYVPNSDPDHARTKRFYRVDGAIKRGVLAFRWFDGTQTTALRNDAWLNHIEGWNDHTRDFRGMACLAMVWRRGINEDTFSGAIPRLLVIGNGHQDVYDWATEARTYRNNALDCFFAWLEWEYGPFQTVDEEWAKIGVVPADWDQTVMGPESNVADENLEDGDRYDCAYQIESGVDPGQVYDTFDFLLGGLDAWLRPNGLWAARCGHVRSAVARFDLDQVAVAPEVTRHRPHADKYNTVIVTYISDTNLYEVMEAVKRDGAYVRADNGEQLFAPVENRGRHGKNSNQRLALIKLDLYRLEEAVIFDCWYRFGTDMSGNLGAALRVEPGDVVEITYSKRGWINKEFKLTGKTFDPGTMMFTGLTLIEWGGIRWDGEGDTPEEVGDDFGKWDGRLEPPTGLIVVSIGQPGVTQPDGSLVVTVLIDVDDHPETAIVGFLGGYAFRWRREGDTKWTTVEAAESRAFANVRSGNFTFEASVLSTAGGRSIRSEWTAELIQAITSEFIELPTAVSDTSQGRNLVSDWDFRRSAVIPAGVDNPYWNPILASGQDGSVRFLATGGKVSPTCAIIFSGSTDQYLTMRVPAPIRPGEIYNAGVSVINVDGDAAAPEYAFYVRYRDLNKIDLTTQAVVVEEYTDVVDWKRVEMVVQVPQGAFVPRDAGIEADVAASGSGLTAAFPQVSPSANNRLGIAFLVMNAAATIETNPQGGDVFEPDVFEPGVFGFAEPWQFEARQTSATGGAKDISILSYLADLSGGHPTDGNETILQNAGDGWVVLAFAIGGDAIQPDAAPAVAQKGTASFQTNPATDLTPSYPVTGLAAGHGWLLVVAVHGDDDRAIATPAGWSLIRSRNSAAAMTVVSLYTKQFGAAGTESGTQAVDWAGSNAVAGAWIWRVTGNVGQIAFAEVQMRALHDDVNGQSSTFKFDQVVLQETEHFTHEEFDNVLNQTNTALADKVIGEWIYAPAESKDVELNVSFDWEVEVLGQFTSSQETLFLSIVYERESDGAMTQLGGATKKVYVMRDVTETFSAAGRYSYQVFAPISVASGSSKSDRFRFKLRMSVSDENIEYSVRDIRMHRLVEI